MEIQPCCGPGVGEDKMASGRCLRLEPEVWSILGGTLSGPPSAGIPKNFKI